jgi:two-component system chemotaxis sensor kinase CheA
MVREHIFPLIRIHDLFNVKGAVEKPWEGIVMLVDIGGSKAGILVDELVDKQEIVIKSMGEQFQSLPGISGGAILGDGTVGLILDIPNLMQVRDAKRNEERERIIAERYGGQAQSVVPGQA